MSSSTLCCAVVFAALEAGVSLVSILQAGDWARVSIPAGHHFSAYITPTYQWQDSVQCSVSCPGSQLIVTLLVSVKH